MRVCKRTACEFLTPAVRPGDCWHFSEVVEWLASLPGDLTLERIRGQSRPLLQYQIVRDGGPVFKLVINLTQDRCWITLSAKQLPDSFRLVEKRMIAIPGKVYRTAENVYELEPGAVQLNLMITQLANSMLRSETGVERSMAMRTLGYQTGTKRQKKQNFNQFVETLDGVVIVKYTPCQSPRKDRFVFEKDGKVGEVVWFGWLHPTGIDAIQKFAYCELDATFYCLKPYVLSMPHFIYKNCSYPIGIFFGPGESCELYDLIFEAVAIFNEHSEQKLNFKFVVLSDRGSGLKKFCEKRSLPQFYCHRHLIEWFGTQSVMSAMMLKILRSPNLKDFLENVQLSNEVFNRLLQQGRLPEDTKKKYVLFTGQQTGYSKRVLLGQELPIEVWRWALWTRGCVTTCSNHVESFHRVLNHAVSKNGRRLGLFGCLREVKRAMEEKQKGWDETFTRNVKNQHSKGRGVCGDKEQCTCWYGEQIARRYQSQVRFPCHHLTEKAQDKLMEEFLRQGLQNLAHVKIKAMKSRYVKVYETAEATYDQDPDQERDTNPVGDPKPETPDGSDDPIEEVARDIYWLVKPQLRGRLRKPFAWVLAWTFHALTCANIDPKKERAEAYDAAWTAVKTAITQINQ